MRQNLKNRLFILRATQIYFGVQGIQGPAKNVGGKFKKKAILACCSRLFFFYLLKFPLMRLPTKEQARN